MNYRLPSAIQDGAVFQPHGICYDSYGRIIVADPDNHSVVRLVRDRLTQTYMMEPLLMKTGTDEWSWMLESPKLVATGPGNKLWVVCREYLLVFDYCTEFQT